MKDFCPLRSSRTLRSGIFSFETTVYLWYNRFLQWLLFSHFEGSSCTPPDAKSWWVQKISSRFARRMYPPTFKNVAPPLTAVSVQLVSKAAYRCNFREKKHKLIRSAWFEPGTSRAAGKRATTRPLPPAFCWSSVVKYEKNVIATPQNYADKHLKDGTPIIRKHSASYRTASYRPPVAGFVPSRSYSCRRV